ncbi:hypothetical protein S245_040357 [Arachis hypogaea]|uniref:Patatin n=1 Tax=Arachis hypogaea TaxID=3818 RepID=A0A445AHW8_ARAHY|nr:Triacylglycerol lipase [Arachis hypogaea]RYR26039.1 hypothetical protein Ahy_B02g060158 [Arachis hypogaea]
MLVLLKTLVEHKLMPRIIAGSSVGSIICAVVATRSWPELQSFFEDSLHSLQFFDQMGGIFSVVKRVTTLGAVHEIRQLQMMLRHLTSNLTFQEAYDMTGRILGITVCSPRKHEPPRCLNYLTSPNVVIWSAVTASCAFPGLFEAQELMAKDRSGQIVPYHPPFNLGPEEGSSSARRWRDGSLEMDLPMMQLKELFNVNHFIVSQANPHISPLLRMKEFVRAYGGNFAAKLAHLVEMEVKHRCNQILELGFPLGGIAKLFAQEWEGDVTVVMPATLAQYSKIIQNPSYMELQKANNQGRRCTWEKLSAIKANCGIELALDECVVMLNHMRRLKRSAARAAAAVSSQGSGFPPAVKFCGARRIPSWNVIARENSTGSLEDLILGANGPNETSGKNWKSNRSAYDGSDCESECSDSNSWTRTGGPLMRTTSSNLFIDFVQHLEIDIEPSTSMPGRTTPHDFQYHSPRVTTPDRSSSESDQRENGNKVFTNGSSIMVTEGDLLQPERIHNGIVFNVIKKEDLSPSSRSHDSFSNEVAESVQIYCPGKEMDTASTVSDSENGDNETITPDNNSEVDSSADLGKDKTVADR